MESQKWPYGISFKKAGKNTNRKEEAEAASKLQSLYRGRAARLRIKEHKEQENAAKKIQGRFRIKAAKKDLASRRYAAQQKSKQSERLALENRMALRIQCAWRGRKGRLATHLKMQARKAREREERKQR